MATRVFCDHCGNTISNPNVFSYGPLREALQEMQNFMVSNRLGATQSSISQSPNSQGVAQTRPKIKIVDIDLCDHCAPIWMERVRQLTAKSDV